jgi:TMEM175 potassium channel family protein
MSTSRTQAFSDGVLAIAITLLVLDLKVPATGRGGLWHALLREWPAYSSYVVSFLVIGTIWVNHHAVFEQIVRTDRALLFLNLILLLTIAFIPFPTALLARYLRDGGSSAHVAAAVYSGSMAAMGTAFGGLWLYASRGRRLLDSGVSDAEVSGMTRSFVIGTPFYMLAIGIAFVSPVACLALNALLAVFYMFERGGAMRLGAGAGDRPPPAG